LTRGQGRDFLEAFQLARPPFEADAFRQAQQIASRGLMQIEIVGTLADRNWLRDVLIRW
jgi:hypothetical protein